MPTSLESPRRRPAEHLSIDGISAGYGGNLVVRDLHVGIGRGEVVLVVGPNGSGKSTFLKALVGQLPVRDGRVVLDGVDVTNERTELLARRGIAYVPQEGDVFPPLTVRDNLRVGGYHLTKAQAEQRIAWLFGQFPHLAAREHAPAAQLSGGERKMLGVARALMTEPSVLILDEPTAQLAPAVTAQILSKYARAMADAGQAVLVVEQKALQALAVADWTYVLVSGQMVANGPPGEFSKERLTDLFLGKVRARSVAASDESSDDKA